MKVGVVGAGTMGSGIAQTFAMNGHDVTMVDVAEAQLERGLATIRGSLAKLAEKDKLVAPPGEIAARIRAATDVAALADADLVVEAAYEDPAVKQELFATLDRVTRKDVILASNTSSISIDALAARTTRPGRVAGMHFMNPVPVMRLVEVVRGPRTSEETLGAIVDLAKRLGKTPVVSADRPGFIANRILMPMINEAFLALDEKVGTAEDIDTVMTLGMNHPIGPLRLADLIGLDVCVAIMEVLERDLGSAKYAPAPNLRRLVAEGRLGRKSGRGVYDYEQSRVEATA
ncbi:MAG TPA: 3-hydroxyacyl-CoA dehydrogenase NAD-binding domain-containing protein [Candidatus Limnocylindria bacterium]|nr:3-hydroxyacyl-CoA dehydrogenase NAD-binding domain-containing protein [Candidatus Limnocylindria bacterium]